VKRQVHPAALDFVWPICDALLGVQYRDVVGGRIHAVLRATFARISRPIVA
jgi:hypothetical protein